MKFTTLALLAAFFSAGVAPSNAATISDLRLDPGVATPGNFGPSSFKTGSFSDYYNFSLDANYEYSATVAQSLGNTKIPAIQNLAISLYSGVYASAPLSSYKLLDSDVAFLPVNGPSQTATIDDLLQPGSYFFVISGTGLSTPSQGNSQNANYGVTLEPTLSAVPLPASLPLFGGGLVVLAGVCYGLNRRGGVRSAEVASV